MRGWKKPLKRFRPNPFGVNPLRRPGPSARRTFFGFQRRGAICEALFSLIDERRGVETLVDRGNGEGARKISRLDGRDRKIALLRS